ncbi:MAG: hypothetical protein HW412_368, partial [Bacteroidetes bacterium]|nr:hypothetical protein [Bacteroidota bacterium]
PQVWVLVRHSFVVHELPRGVLPPPLDIERVEAGEVTTTKKLLLLK